jgi:transglutaminase-like putative cysteine protease
MNILRIQHRTSYQYRSPVQLGEHRLMTRPRDSHDLRLLDSALTIDPAPSQVRWIHDVFGNSIAIVHFDGSVRALGLSVTSDFRAEHFPASPEAIFVDPYACRLPFQYSGSDVEDLGRTRERHYADPERRIEAWTSSVLQRLPQAGTLDALNALTLAIKKGFRYEVRQAAGVQSPLETLERRSGSCRDFALLMMEAVRTLGLAARFVSGYLYDDARVGAGAELVGGGSTHAWLQVYLPGAGWVEYDPTNALVGGRNLIRVAVTRDPCQAIPLAGSFIGAPDAHLAMSVNVEITTS